MNRLQKTRQLVESIKAIDKQISDYYSIAIPRELKNNEINRLAISRKSYELELAKMGIVFNCLDTGGAHCLDIIGLEAVLNAIEGKR